MAPTVAHCVSLPAPQEGAARLRAAGRRAGMAPTVAHCVSLPAPQEGAARLRAAGRRAGAVGAMECSVRVFVDSIQHEGAGPGGPAMTP